MVDTGAVLGCTNVAFYLFSEDTGLYLKRRVTIKRSDNIHSKVCKDHFTDKEACPKRHYFMASSVPSIFQSQ